MRKRMLRAALVAIIPLIVVIVGTTWVLAEDTGWTNPSDNTIDTDGGFDNPTYAYCDDVNRAQKCYGDGGLARHVYSAYGTGVPDCAIIEGIEVRLDWYLDTTSGDSTMSAELSGDAGANWSAPKTDSNRTLSEHTAILGGATDTWGQTWTSDDFDDPNEFQVRVTVSDTDE
jgi:hypothetical protein